MRSPEADGRKGEEKMKIRIDGTDKVIDIGIVDPKSGVNWIGDFVGNEGGFGSIADGLIDQDPKNDSQHLATAETVAWWQDMIAAYVAMDETIEQYRERYGRETIDDYLMTVAAYDVDLIDLPGRVKCALVQYDAAQ